MAHHVPVIMVPLQEPLEDSREELPVRMEAWRFCDACAEKWEHCPFDHESSTWREFAELLKVHARLLFNWPSDRLALDRAYPVTQDTRAPRVH